MAKFNSRKNRKKKRSRYSDIEKFAYNLGVAKRALDKGGNRVTDSYERGLKEREKRSRKPLI